MWAGSLLRGRHGGKQQEASADPNGFVPQNISEGQSNRLFQSAMDRLRPSGLLGAEEGPEDLQGVPGTQAGPSYALPAIQPLRT